MQETDQTVELIKNYINHYLHGEKSTKKINKSTYFNTDQRKIFKDFHKTIKHNVKLLERSNHLLKSFTRKENIFYKDIMNRLYVFEDVDIENRTIYDYSVYPDPVVGNTHNIKEQTRILHVLNSLMNGKHISIIDKNFKEAVSYQIESRPRLSDILTKIVHNYTNSI